MATTRMNSAGPRAHAVPMTDEIPDPEVPERARRPRSYSARYKARILAEYESLDKAGKGALLRREGIYSSLISAWRLPRQHGRVWALPEAAGRPAAPPGPRGDIRVRLGTQRVGGASGPAPPALVAAWPT